jgi:hypothetical protein
MCVGEQAERRGGRTCGLSTMRFFTTNKPSTLQRSPGACTGMREKPLRVMRRTVRSSSTAAASSMNVPCRGRTSCVTVLPISFIAPPMISRSSCDSSPCSTTYR